MIWYGDATWEWDGREWTRTTSASPLVRSGAAMATDPGGGVLLFGGTSPGGAPTDETWRYDAHGWQRLDAGGPSARAGAAMAYDLDHHRALLFGGAPCDDRSLWSWDGKGWSRLVGDGPPSRRDAAMTYDLTTRSMIVAGGRACDGNALRDAWRWNGVEWSRLARVDASTAGCLIYSTTRNRVLLLGVDSARAGRAWQLDGGRWRAVAPRPPALAGAVCASDPHLVRMMIVGRTPASVGNSTWVALQ
jgi:hypothetical protein